ncbi:hypothetical protein WJX75_008192 [Coccomyxa subellipsoidea]|uniref:Uncharacterized protein n=1 Tax=Coccomyxa subellipsoidea TaxID=248742 RepID=A0ABR2Z0P5_9CHLO
MEKSARQRPGTALACLLATFVIWSASGSPGVGPTHLLRATDPQVDGGLVGASVAKKASAGGLPSARQASKPSEMCACKTAMELQLPFVPLNDGVFVTTAKNMLLHITVQLLEAVTGSFCTAGPEGKVTLLIKGGGLSGQANITSAQLRPAFKAGQTYARFPVTDLPPGVYSIFAAFLPDSAALQCSSQSTDLRLQILPPAQTAISWEPITKRGLHAATIFVRNNEAGSVAGPIGKVRAVLQSVTDSSQKIRRVLDLVSFNASAATAEFNYESLGARSGIHDLSLTYLPSKPEESASSTLLHEAAITLQRKLGTPVTDDEADRSLGRTFDLISSNFVQKASNLVGGRALFADGYELCYSRSGGLPGGDKKEKYIESYRGFLDYVKGDLNVDAPYDELQITANASFEWLNSNEQENLFYVVQIAVTLYTYVLDEECLDYYHIGLNDALVSDLYALPPPCIDGCDSPYPWTAYQDFINNWGSQWMSSYDTGATFSQWIRASMSEELDEKKMHAAACLRMLGVEGEAPFGACADVTADQREEARKYFVTSNSAAFGGTKDLLSEVLLEDPVNPDTLRKFLSSADLAEAPAVYHWTSTLGSIKKRVDDPDLYNKVTVLQQYLEGYLGFGCERRTTPAGFILEYWQYIEYAGGVNYYSCMERCQGCHSEDDCHNHLAHGWCYGDSCIFHEPLTGKAMVAQTR